MGLWVVKDEGENHTCSVMEAFGTLPCGSASHLERLSGLVELEVPWPSSPFQIRPVEAVTWKTMHYLSIVCLSVGISLFLYPSTVWKAV